MPFERIAILGAGSWGTALANAACRAGRHVRMWSHDPQEIDAIKRSGETPRLPGVQVDPRILVTLSLDEGLDADAALLVIPAQAVRSVAEKLSGTLSPGLPVVVCAKGIERGTNKFMSEIVAECAPQATPAILSGPSFAADVARGLPTAVTLAADDDALAADLAHALSSPGFRIYHSTDIRGVEIGGAAKNVLAIAAGIVVGRGLGDSAAAALTTRGFAELMRFGRHFGARPETLTGLSGLGDLILTCSSPQSRNFAYGVSLGRGQPDTGGKLVEGALTASVVVEMARKNKIDMPISAAVAAILDGSLSVDKAIESLLTRPIGAEV